jgi:hypothetical protein
MGVNYGMKKYWYIVILAVSLLLLAGCIPSFNEPPNKPSNPNPADEATGVPIDVTLSWQASDPDGDTLKYDLYFGKAQDDLTKEATDLTTNSYEFTESLDYETTYYWQVVAKDPDGETATSPVWSFTTTGEPNLTPNAPSNPSPADGAAGVPIDVTLSWQASDPDGDTLKYDLYFGKVQDDLTKEATDLTTNSYEFTESLDYETTYYWQVVAKDPDGETATSPVWSFTTTGEPNAAPNAPSNPDPENGATGVSVTPILFWQASDPDGDTLTYDLYFGDVQDNLTKEATDLTTDSYTFTESLEEGERYYWKVVAKDPDGETATSPVWSFRTTEEPTVGEITFSVVAYNAGPAVGAADVVVKSGNYVLAQDVTDENGEITFDVANFHEKINVEIKKEGYALSKVEGLKVADFVNNIKEVQLREAILDPDPDTQTFPEIKLTFYNLNENSLDITQPVTEDFLLRVDVDSQNSPQIIYAKIGGDPGAGFFGPRESASDTRTAYFFMDISNYNGEVPLYVEFVDYNDNIVQKIEYLTINREVEEVEEELFVPLSWVDFGLWNLVAYTRNQGVEFYSRDNLVETMSEKFDSSNNKLPQDFNSMKNFGKSLEAAPEGTNLWVEISWVDYDTLDEAGLIDPNEIRPDAYNVYRSFDGVSYTKIGIAEDGYFLDPSSQNAPNKKVWYAVSSYRGDEESELVELGSLVPLDSFSVNLKSPADRAKNVSRQPTFVWEPTKELTSPESEVEYYYTMWIYDLVQSENYMLPGILIGSDIYTYDFMTLGAEEVSVTFLGSEGSSEYDDLSWFLYLPDGIYYYEYDKLEPAKTYDWGVDYAYAVSYDLDSVAYSIAIDYGWGIDPLGGVMPEIHNEFTTGN